MTGKVNPAFPAITTKKATKTSCETETGESVARDQQCVNCLKWFVHVKKHARFCDKAPSQSSTVKAKARCSGAGRDKRIEGNTEEASSQVIDHSAIETITKPSHFKSHTNAPEGVEIRKKLNLPKANDERWKMIDADLGLICQQYSTHEDPVVGVRLLEEATYDYLESKCPDESEKATNTDRVGKKKPRQDAECRKLREMKNNSRREWERTRETHDEDLKMMSKVAYLKLVRLHNKARKNADKKDRRKLKEKSGKMFRRNPFEYGKKLLSGEEESSKEPEFDSTTASNFFEKEYKDKERDHVFENPDGLEDLEKPSLECSTEPPTKAEFDEKLKSRRNKSAPGANGVNYLVYKRCPSLSDLLYKLICRIWTSGVVPPQWQVGVSTLIAKTDDLKDPAKFRNITLQNCSGKLFFSLWGDRVLDYMTANKFIDTSVQKGFMKKMPGCVEHTQALLAELKEAKTKRRQIHAVWIDLMNAYGKVPHGLIVYALHRYHLPQAFIDLVIEYYKHLSVLVKCRKWTSRTFWYEIGLFQGDPLSVVLFLIVFNILLELLAKLCSNVGYKPSFNDSKSSKKGFADDLTLITKSKAEMVQMLKVLNYYLVWSVKMKAKPEKCLSMSMKRQDGGYSTYDAEFEIGEAKVPSIIETPMKFLGMYIYVDLDVKEIRLMIEKKLDMMLELTDKDDITGPMKAWVYNNLIISKMSWSFTVYNLPITYVKGLEATCNRYLKRWLGVAHPCTTTVLYRNRAHKGLQLKNITTEYKVIQVIKGHQLSTSSDPYIRSVYNNQKLTAGSQTRWSYAKELEDRKRQLYFQELVGRANEGTRGLGFNSKYEYTSERKMLTNMVRTFDEDTLLISLFDKKKQGRFLTWENTMTFDTAWNNLIYKLSPELLKFHVNALHDTNATPANLKLWNKHSTGNCTLCNKPGTLNHILTFCPLALKQGRYNYRHDQVLREIMTTVFPRMRELNSDGDGDCNEVKPKTVFHSAGNKRKKVAMEDPCSARKQRHFFSDTNDWKIVFDEDERQRNFPQHIATTGKRPDVVIYSNKLKKVYLMELTCGNEQNFAAQEKRKLQRYKELVDQIENNGWKCKLQTVEVGVRGIYNQSLQTFLNHLDVKMKDKKKACAKIAEISLRASYTIYLCRNNNVWTDDWELVKRPS